MFELIDPFTLQVSYIVNQTPSYSEDKCLSVALLKQESFHQMNIKLQKSTSIQKPYAEMNNVR